MNTYVNFINDSQIKVVTKRGEELLGHLRCPARSEEEKNIVIDHVSCAFEETLSCGEAERRLSNTVVLQLIGVLFEFTLTPSDVQRIRLGKRIKELREARGLSARELAFLTRIDPSNLSKIEQGKHAVNVDTLNKIAFYLDAQVQINFIENESEFIDHFNTLDTWK